MPVIISPYYEFFYTTHKAIYVTLVYDDLPNLHIEGVEPQFE